MAETDLSRSYVHGGPPEPLMGQTVGGLLDATARRWPDGEALVIPHQQVHWTWATLRDNAHAIGAGLLALGLEPGDRVGMLAPNCAEWVVVQFGTACAGLILVNINPASRAPNLEYALNKSGCRALVTATSFKSSDYISMLRGIAPELHSGTPGALCLDRFPTLNILINLGEDSVDGFLRYPDVVSGANKAWLDRLDQVSAQLDFDDPINIQFTSGTTGVPKAATLTHHNIVNNAWLSGSIMRFSEADRLCIPVPMYHCFGMVLGTLLCVAHGATMVFPSAGFDAGAVLESVEAERCTAIHGVPTMFIAELDHPDFGRRDLSSLRTGIMAGAPCPVELMQRVMQEMHLEDITIGYGMTETGPLSTQTLVDDPVELRVGTVGRALPHTEIKIVDKDGRILPPGEPGELCTRGYCVMRGYWDDPERTSQEIDAAHWIRSGDIATLDDNGYVRIEGRIKDMVIRGGENIYPREIEAFLYTHPAVEQVEVFGVPDKKYGEEVAAWIRLQPGDAVDEEGIRDFCQGKLEYFKIPRYIRFVEEFPMTITGKVQKFVMRERMAEELGCTAKEHA